jgi:hypothetical protein
VLVVIKVAKGIGNWGKPDSSSILSSGTNCTADKKTEFENLARLSLLNWLQKDLQRNTMMYQ